MSVLGFLGPSIEAFSLVLRVPGMLSRRRNPSLIGATTLCSLLEHLNILGEPSRHLPSLGPGLMNGLLTETGPMLFSEGSLFLGGDSVEREEDSKSH